MRGLHTVQKEKKQSSLRGKGVVDLIHKVNKGYSQGE